MKAEIMTDKTSPEVLAMALKISEQLLPDGGEYDLSIARDAAVQAILETTEAAAKMPSHARATAESLRNFDHLKP